MPRSEVVAWADGYRLDLDPTRPRTSLGVLAGHVAWEHRISAMSELHVRPTLRDLDSCPLTAYALRLGEAADATHREVLTQRGTSEHRAAWERLLVLVKPA